MKRASDPNQADEPLTISRRQFLTGLSVALSAAAAAVVGLPVVGFLIAPLIEQTPEAWREVGAVDDFKIGTTTAVTYVDASPLPWSGVTANTAAWLHRAGVQDFKAFSINCTHLGCPVRWLSTPNCSCVPVMAACTMRTAPWRQGRRHSLWCNILCGFKTATSKSLPTPFPSVEETSDAYSAPNLGLD